VSVKGYSIVPANNRQLLYVGRGFNFQLTSDQVLTKVYTGAAFAITDVYARQRTGGASVACAGGIYDGAAKTGNIWVAAAQSWVTLAASVNVVATVNLPSTLGTAGLILSLTTGSTAAVTGDLYVFGYDLS
jgi:hypothetical protein